ncbi:MAG: hypothetical protein V3U96_06630 [Paracoccaceae bacterium]
MLLAQPAAAQSGIFDADRLLQMCAESSCVDGVQISVGQILLLRLPPEEFNSQLGVIASVLFQAAKTADQVLADQLALGLRSLSKYSTDAVQRQSFFRVAELVSNGSSELFDLNAPFAVSPS